MRQEQRKPAQPAPLGFARRDELVDDDLRAVGEIAELGFPDGQGFRRGGGVTVFEGQDRLLGQQRVDNVDVDIRVDVFERRVRAAVQLVVQHGVPVEKGAAARILSDQPELAAFLDQAGVCEVFRESPVHGNFPGGHFLAVFVDTLDAVVQLELSRQARQGV